MSEEYDDSKIKRFALNSNKSLTQPIADEAGVSLGKASVDHFSEGEIRINIEESIRGCHAFVIQSTSVPTMIT